MGSLFKHDWNRRPGTVLVMVVAVLAMLFIIGSSLLVVARFERVTGITHASARNLQAAGGALADPLMVQLREDGVGDNGLPYDRFSGNASETSGIEDPSDLPGKAGGEKNGDRLLSSLEPYLFNAARLDAYLREGGQSPFRLFAPSRGFDNDGGGENHVSISLTDGPQGDADGDGVRDADPGALSALAGKFGPKYALQLRIVPHGGMVLLDRATHISLLSQVIHGEDAPYRLNPLQLWTDSVPVRLDAGTEAELRRRWMLPRYLGRRENGEPRTHADLPSWDLRSRLPVTLGYKAPSKADAAFRELTPHWWPVSEVAESSEERHAERSWWASRVMPVRGPQEAGYRADADLYDRRRLLTTISSDDILRASRDERRLAAFVGPVYRDRDEDQPFRELQPFFSLLNPPESPLPDTEPALSDVWNGTDRWLGGFAGPLHYGRDADPRPTPLLLFNVPGLRVKFSLRDVLEDPITAGGHQASYRKALQLTAYFLAMTLDTAAMTTSREHLRTAMQLAVNTIDYADNWDTNGNGELDAGEIGRELFSYFAWPPGDSNAVRVLGVEKQPYITEVYAKRTATYDAAADRFEDAVGEDLYAVELYNPYETPVDLTGLVLRVVVAGDPPETLAVIPLDGASVRGRLGTPPRMPAGSYLVIANRDRDATVTGINRPFTGPSPQVAVEPALKLANRCRIQIQVTSARILNLNTLAADPVPPIVIDEINTAPYDPDHHPNGVRLQTTPFADPNILNGDRNFARSIAREEVAVEDGAYYWRHTSIQRQKESDPAGGTATLPSSWRFTLGLAIGVESPIYSNLAPGTTDGPPVHGILDADGSGKLHDDDDVIPEDPVWAGVAAFPVLVADRGISPTTGGTLAFPTTGSLLLVTRYAHLPSDTDFPVGLPVSAAAVRAIPKKEGGTIRSDLEQLRQIDNGHMPVVDDRQQVRNSGRLNGLPWGLLVYEYFTALPLEELFRGYDLRAPPFNLGNNLRLMDIPSLGGLSESAREEKYRQVYQTFFPGYPLIQPFGTGGTRYPVGTRVLGRININFAPWWVLDGLPVLPDVFVGDADNADDRDNPLSGLPVPQLVSNRLDPSSSDYGTGSARYERAGRAFSELLTDTTIPPARGMSAADRARRLRESNVSANFARYTVAYREQRSDDDPALPDLIDLDRWALGFPTVGNLADMLRRVPRQVGKPASSPPGLLTIEGLRTWVDPQTGTRPYSHLGYLHLVVPLVRLQDWATVRSHVFTIYAGVGDTSSEPGLWLRSQMTVDRTRCLYTPDLPVLITETPPVSYHDALND